jgi:Ion channel
VKSSEFSAGESNWLETLRWLRHASIMRRPTDASITYDHTIVSRAPHPSGWIWEACAVADETADAEVSKQGSTVRRIGAVPWREVRGHVMWSGARATFGAVVLLAGYYFVPATPTTGAQIAFRIVAGVVAIVAVLAWQTQSIGRSEYPQLQAIEALVVTVTLMVVLFASLYLTLSDRDTSAFTEPLGRTGALYFTLTTLTTVGFGDIAARTDAARIAVMIQMLFNVAVIGVSVRLIIGMARRRLDT